MNYVTIKNGVVSPITERKQLYYKDPSIVGEFNFKSTEQDINTTKWAPGGTTNGHYDTVTINGVNFPVNIVPDLDYRNVVKEYEIKYKFDFSSDITLDNGNAQSIGWFSGNRTLPDKEGNFYNKRHHLLFVYKNKINLNMGTKSYNLEDGTVDFNTIKSYQFSVYRNNNGKLIITSPYNRIEEDNFDKELNIMYYPFIMLIKYESVNNKSAFGMYYGPTNEFNITGLELNFIARNKITI